MSRKKLLGLLVVLSSYSCKTTEAAGAKAAKEIKATVNDVAKDPATAQKPTQKSSLVLMQWIIGRYNLELKGNEAIEVRSKPGRVHCEITEAAVRQAFGEKTLTDLKTALITLNKVRGSTQRNPMFRSYKESIELVSLLPGELTLEMSYQAMEVLVPNEAVSKDAFENAYSLASSVATPGGKICPKLPDL